MGSGPTLVTSLYLHLLRKVPSPHPATSRGAGGEGFRMGIWCVEDTRLSP